MAKPAKFNGLIESYINNRVGQIISPAEVISAVNCTAPTVYAYIKNNSYRFEKISAGKYRVLEAVIGNQFTTENWEILLYSVVNLKNYSTISNHGQMSMFSAQVSALYKGTDLFRFDW